MFNPVQASEEIKRSYIDYITTSFDMADKEYASLFRKELEQEGSSTKGPYLDIGGSYETGHTLQELINSGDACPLFSELEPVAEKVRELKLERPLYIHQEKALKKASSGQNLVVTTGTGSGKTECFLLPVLQHILTQVEKGDLNSGVRAIIIYPMNALANDQIKRMRALLKNYPKIRFGIYTGNTEHQHSKALTEYRKTHKDASGQSVDPLPNELISREEMQEEPPHILITNYSMLEYMMLRPKDDAVFSDAKLKYIILDEAHIYKGATGMETSLLMRRLRARISKPNEVQYILTSATLGGPDADAEILQFANKLTGVTFDESGIIRSTEKVPSMMEERAVDPQLFTELCKAPDSVGDILKREGLDYCPDGSAEEKLYWLCLHLSLFSVLRRAAVKPVTVSELYSQLRIAAPAITKDQVVEFVQVCARAELDGANLIKPRYHFFARALEGAYVTLSAPKELFLNRKHSQTLPDGTTRAVFEAAICNDCGRLAIVGQTAGRKFVQSARNSGEDAAEYYLLINSNDGELFLDDDILEFEEENDGMLDFVLCPVCGSISTKADLQYSALCMHDSSNYVNLRKVTPQKSNQPKCPACGSGRYRRFYVGNEAATSVLGTELFEQLPDEEAKEIAVPVGKTGLFARPGKKIVRQEKARQFLCFSDSRSEAAFFAVYMERSYKEFLRRRGIWHIAESFRNKGRNRVSVTDFADELARYFEANCSFAEWDSDKNNLTSESRKNAWIAIMNEMFNARRATSLVSLGRIAFAYRRNKDLADVIAGLGNGLPLADAEALLEQISMNGVFTGALNAGKEIRLTEAEREYIFFSPYEKKLIKVKTASDSKKTSLTGWCGRVRTNGKGGYYPNIGISRLTAALGITSEEADAVLQDYWDGVFQAETERFSLDANDFDVLIGGTDAVHFYRCRKCGKITPYNILNMCSSVKCDGQLEPYEPLAYANENHYARLYQSEQMKPLFIKEHTAQLAKNQQTMYQEAFVNKKINALSCSTTFEMGVDVGSLETVYLRDVPPSPSNYVQRAGRAGRGKGSAAFVLTYAKLSSHDFTYYENPERMISGTISAPVFEVENEKILYRHVFAVAISAFLSENTDVYDGDNQTVLLNEGGYERLQAFLAEKPEYLKTLLEHSIPKAMHHRLGIDDWSWVGHLCGPAGLLELAVKDFRDTVADMEKQRDRARKDKNDEEAYSWDRTLQAFRAATGDSVGGKKVEKSLISFLVRNNILPKYGFPVDTVELLPHANSVGNEKELQLARDLQMAIADYAPGSQVVADGKLYTSRYIRKSPGNNTGSTWEIGYYCHECPNCGQPNFTKEPIIGSRECVSCHTPIKKIRWSKTLEPRLGFCADLQDEPVPLTRPEHDYKTDDIYVGDPQRNILQAKEFYINDQLMRIASTSNDSLVVVGQTEFRVCQSCGYAHDIKVPDIHKTMRGYTCNNKDGKVTKGFRLSHDFKTDVVRLTFISEDAGDRNTMLSVLYALLEGISRELGIERTDIKGCLFRTYEEGEMIYSVILYDAVAGGAGHVRRMVTSDGKILQRVLRKAYSVVNDCSCGSSCYKCLRNYYNQKIHDLLDRTKAAAFLKNWLGEMCLEASNEEIKEEPNETVQATEASLALPDDFGMNMKDSQWNFIWTNTATSTDDSEEHRKILEFADFSSLFETKEKPYSGCTILIDGVECSCDLLWRKSRVLFFTSETIDDFDAATRTDWKCFNAGDINLSAQMIADALLEE